MHKKVPQAEECLVTEPGTPPKELIYPAQSLEIGNKVIHNIISSNQELIQSQMKAIRQLQLANIEKNQKIKLLQGKYETLIQFAVKNNQKNQIQPYNAGIQQQNPNIKGYSSIDIQAMISTIQSLQQKLSITKVQLAIKLSQQLTNNFTNLSHKQGQIKRRSSQSQRLAKEKIQNIFENSSNYRGFLTSNIKDSLNSQQKQLVQSWYTLIDNYGHFQYKLYKIKQKSSSLIKKFIPRQIRKNVWPYLAHNKLGMTNSLYIQLLQRRQKGWVCSKVKTQIEKDIKRSFYGKTNYQMKTGIILQVAQFLQIFHIYRPDVSYVQGMTYPVMILIPVIGKIKAFNVFCNIILGNCFFRKLFSMQGNFISVMCRGFQLILEQYLPQLNKKFKEMSIQSQIYLIEWIFTMFSRGLSIDTTHKFWDIFLYYQEVTMFRMTLSILQQIEPYLMQLNFQEIINFIRQYGHNIKEQKLLQRLINNKLSAQKMYKYFQKVKI